MRIQTSTDKLAPVLGMQRNLARLYSQLASPARQKWVYRRNLRPAPSPPHRAFKTILQSSVTGVTPESWPSLGVSISSTRTAPHFGTIQFESRALLLRRISICFSQRRSALNSLTRCELYSSLYCRCQALSLARASGIDSNQWSFRHSFCIRALKDQIGALSVGAAGREKPKGYLA